MLKIFILSGPNSSDPAITYAFNALLLVFAVRVFYGIITTPGTRTSISDIIFTLVATVILSLLVGAVGSFILFNLNNYSPVLAWVTILAISLMWVIGERYGKQKKARELADNHRFHEAFMARHAGDLCRYCDAYKTGDGVIHHAPSCSQR